MVLHGIELQHTEFHGISLYSIVLHGIAWFWIVLHGIVCLTMCSITYSWMLSFGGFLAECLPCSGTIYPIGVCEM